MKYWTCFDSYEFHIKKNICEDIFTFDIETTSLIRYEENFYSALFYDTLDDSEKEKCESFSYMYIWQFGINENVYFGRTWDEFRCFLYEIDKQCKAKKLCYVHNLGFEFQFMRNAFTFKKVFARKQRHVMKFELEDFEFEFRCSLTLSNVKLAKLSEVYHLPVKKLEGDLDYSIIRNRKTRLTARELGYCENDCLVLYYYIKFEKENNKKVPLTYTGHVRNALKNELDKNYKIKLTKEIDTNPVVYNRLIESFAGGYTHASWAFTDYILHNVKSFDFSSSYPYVMLSEKYPSSKFNKIDIKKIEELSNRFCYIIKIKFWKIKSKYINDILSLSKCLDIKKGIFDNGRVQKAEMVEFVCVEVDLKLFLEFYSYEKYEIEECYRASKSYLPEKFYNFILDKYKEKTTLKGVKDREVEYALAKNQFNALYGMSVTNNIRNEVIFDGEWDERELDNSEILMKLFDEKQKGFLNFSWGVYVTRLCKAKFTGKR